MIATLASGATVELNDDGTWKYAQELPVVSEGGDFRSLIWGMTPAQVREREGGSELTELPDGTLCLTDSVAGHSYFVYFRFHEGRLLESSMALVDEFVNENSYVNAFWQLKARLTQKYGEPTEDSIDWFGDLYRDDVDEWGKAVNRGEAVFNARWVTPRTAVALRLSGENFESHLYLSYTSRSHESTLNERNERAILDKL